MDLTTIIGDAALPSGIGAAMAIIIVTIIKARAGDRQLILDTQQEHIATLTQERKDKDVELEHARATARRQVEDAEGAAIEWRVLYEGEVRLRIAAETKAAMAEGQISRYEAQILDLTEQVKALRDEVAGLRKELSDAVDPDPQGHRPPTGQLRAVGGTR